MSRWNEFRGSREDYPETWFEVDVFLSNAIMHLRGRDEIDARIELCNARDRVSEARNGVSILAKIEVAA